MPIQLYIALLVPQTTRGTWQEVSSSVSAPVARRRESAANLLSVLMVAHMHSALELRTSSLDRRCPTRTFLGCTGPSHQSFRYVLARVLNDPRLEWCGVAVVCVELTLALPWCMQGRDRCSQCSRCLHQKYGAIPQCTNPEKITISSTANGTV